MPWRNNNNYGQQMGQWGQPGTAIGAGSFGGGSDWSTSSPMALGNNNTSMPGGGGNGLNFFSKDNGFGMNANTLNFGMQGLGALGNIWGAWQSHKLAKDQLNFTKDFANRNLANQTQAYNTALEDRGRSRAAAEGQTSAEAAAYLDRNRLPTRG